MKRWLDYKGDEKLVYEVGDQVKILRQDIFHLKDVQGEKRWGTITDINGEYIYVRPRYRRWETELYHCEITPRKKSRLMSYDEVMGYTSCKSDNADRMCETCDCWKKTRANCS